MNNDDWSKYLDFECLLYFRRKTGDDFENINYFFEFVKERITIFELLVKAKTWHKTNETEQVRWCVKKVGQYQTSRMLCLMDYISERGVDFEGKR